MAIESPDYEVLLEADGIEFRQYQGFMVAETLVENARTSEEATNEGFRRLFRYISGANTSQSNIEMTSPVITAAAEQGSKIAMTTPVIQTKAESGYAVAFVVPRQYNRDTAPEPTDSRVKLRAVPERLVAVFRFSGRWTTAVYERNKALMDEKLAELGLVPAGPSEYARYNAPYSLPFLRRNEIMVPVRNLPAAQRQQASLSLQAQR